MPSFTGTASIILQPGDADVPYSFKFTICSSATANDGSIPFGRTISSAAVTAHTAAGTDATSELIESSTLSDTTVTIELDYPSTTGTGKYHIKFVLTLDNAAKMEFDFNRIYARDF